MRDALEAFLSSIPGSDSILHKHDDAVALFGYFLSEIAGHSITPSEIGKCYDLARLKAPRNISDVVAKSGAFVRTKDGWALKRDSVTRLRTMMPVVSPTDNSGTDLERRTKVMIIYGRDEGTRADLFNFLRSLHLDPIEWNDAAIRTGKASPYVGEILTAAFEMAQAFMVLMTPDEEVVLRVELRKDTRDGTSNKQPRPNVILEAGMALATDESRTVLVSVGPVRGMSDLDGRHIVRLDNSPERRNDLVQRLKVAGCQPQTDGTDWISLGNFQRWS